MKNDVINVTKSFLPPIDEYKKEIERIWENHWLTNNGELHEEFTQKVCRYLNVENSTLFVNGHMALELAIQSLDLPEGGEVITTPFTFASTTHAIVRNGLKPVFCDINLKDFTIDVDKIEKLITKNTVAIVPVHVFGYPCDVEEIDKISKKYSLKVIYDAAHTFGVEVNGEPIGNFGDISMFSFHATKVFHSIEGGLLTYKDQSLNKKLYMLKNFGITGFESVEFVGVNAKMNEFQAAMGLVNLRYIDEEIEKRRLITNRYREYLNDIKRLSFFEDIKGVKHNYSYFPIIIDGERMGMTRDELHEKLREEKIFTRKYFYPLITDYMAYKNQFENTRLSNAKFISERILTLPIYGSLSEKEQNHILNSISEQCKLNVKF